MIKPKLVRWLIASLTALIVVPAIGAEKSEPKMILLVGNSYTGGTIGPLAAMAKQSPSKSVVKAVVKNGAILRRHLVEDSDALKAIESGDFDIVVFQEQSQLPTLPDKSRASFMASVKELSAIARRNDAEPVLFQTWGRRDGDKQHSKINPDFETMQKNLTTAYEKAAKENDCKVVPVGEIWATVRKKHPDLGRKLYAKDGSHPSAVGSWFLGCVFMKYLLDADVDEIKPGKGVSAADAKLLKACIEEYAASEGSTGS